MVLELPGREPQFAAKAPGQMTLIVEAGFAGHPGGGHALLKQGLRMREPAAVDIPVWRDAHVLAEDCCEAPNAQAHQSGEIAQTQGFTQMGVDVL